MGQSLNKKTGNQSISQYIICRFELAMMEDSTLTDLFPKEQVKVYKKLKKINKSSQNIGKTWDLQKWSSWYMGAIISIKNKTRGLEAQTS